MRAHEEAQHHRPWASIAVSGSHHSRCRPRGRGVAVGVAVGAPVGRCRVGVAVGVAKTASS